MHEVAVRFQQVAKSYGAKRALDNVRLEIPHGQVVGILGPNGAGKSTLFRIITGLTRPDTGEVRIFGEEPGWRTNRLVAYLPDRARWYPNHTGEEAIRWAATVFSGFDAVTTRRLAEFMKLDLHL